MTTFLHTMEGVVVNVARITKAWRGKAQDGMYVWYFETDFGGVYRVLDNGSTPFDPRPLGV
ncbi:MAG: hypothetical protein BroJett013_22920 [Alphaproteobacteria bacterium]|nr:MAG: hypothetical protein BroJett013_22920 [Alphaproteobacteria bacterium]